MATHIQRKAPERRIKHPRLVRQTIATLVCPWRYLLTGNPAAFGCSPLDRKFCVPAFRQVCRYSVEKSGPSAVCGQAPLDRMLNIIGEVTVDLSVD